MAGRMPAISLYPDQRFGAFQFATAFPQFEKFRKANEPVDV
jgi:hypothetical protein